VAVRKPSRGGQHQGSSGDGPGAGQADQRHHGYRRPDQDGPCRRQVGHALDDQCPPALAAARLPRSRGDRKGAIGDHVGGKQQYQRSERWRWQQQNAQAEGHTGNAPQTDRPPVPRQPGAHCARVSAGTRARGSRCDAAPRRLVRGGGNLEVPVGQSRRR
jgi:hypothetical protein